MVEVYEDPFPQPNVPGKCITSISECKEIYDGRIYINYYHYSNWTQGKFASVIRHEIGHAAGLADEPDNPDCIMFPFYVGTIPEFKQVTQDDINGLGCLYGGSFNWGNETFTLSKPEAGGVYKCRIPVLFGGCNGSGNTYDVTIYVKYDADNPNSPWTPVLSLINARGCEVRFPGRESSSLYTQVKVKWFSGGNFKDSIVSGMFTYIYTSLCPEATPDFILPSRCGCGTFNIMGLSIPSNFQRIELFDITGRRIFFTDRRNKEFFINALKDLPEGSYFLRIITKEKIYVRKFVSMGK